ncbi:membrane glycoprotein US6A [Mandrillus leucophaeus cytomegalovirus]|uniref:Membrane glycoprotein US6A n=1 Tax=Mandrillus leucophaeus cytomegalovirus TaxID=1654930 RepID=A0A0G2UGE5_9BETA|nr:membrane glycoprotein US6A [Mandrillus leucophaeus cytomegalovirus]AKI29720.1 membrane glycoprotein US6A [Mandrillus leucophaeus cytomegalovirus]
MLRYLCLWLSAAFLLFELSCSCENEHSDLLKIIPKKMFNLRSMAALWKNRYSHCTKPRIPRRYIELRTTCEVNNDRLHTSGAISGNFTDTAWLHVQIANKFYEDRFFVVSTNPQHPPIIMNHEKYMYGIKPETLVTDATHANEWGITKEVRVEDKRVFYYKFEVPVTSYVQRVIMHVEPETKLLMITCEPTYGLNYNPKIWTHYMRQWFLPYRQISHDVCFILGLWAILMLFLWGFWYMFYKDDMERAAYIRMLNELYRERYRRTDHKVSESTYDIDVAKTSTDTTDIEHRPPQLSTRRRDARQAFS